jgi:hypothetical protein
LLPTSTKGYVSILSPEQLGEKWQQTQFGKLAADPVMEPFIADLRRQIREKLLRSSAELGLTWDDMRGVQNGEICFAMIQPDGDQTRHATALLVDVTDRAEATAQLMDKIAEHMQQRGATKGTQTVDGTVITGYTIPSDRDASKSRVLFLFVKQQQLVAVSDEEEALAILARLDAGSSEVLGSFPVFQQVMRRCREASGDLQPLVRWYVEPLGYGHVVRAAAGGRKRRGKDRLKILAEQGFDAIQGVGGHVNLATGEHELLHRTFVYAPPVKRAGGPEGENYNLAARMLDFPNRSGLSPQPWVPRELATYITCNWRMQEAFGHSKTLVDSFLGEGFFDDFFASLRDDLSGPQIDVRKELVAHLGQRATFLSDNVVPVTPESERVMLALELTDAQAVAANLDRALEDDPSARRLEVNGHTIWEILNEEEEEMPAVVIDGIGLTPIPSFDAGADEPEKEAERRILANSALAVAHGQLLVTSNIDLMKRIVSDRPSPQTLASSIDFQVVNHSLQLLGAGEDCLRLFSRSDEANRTTYELIRQNRMPESENLVGRLLNRLLAPDEEGVLREQQINGEKLPDYQVVRRYLGPGGLYVRSLDDGWMITGVMLNKDQIYDAQFERAPLATASAKTE